MTNLEELGRRLDAKLAVSEERRRLRKDHMQEFTRAAEQAHAVYTTVADRLMDSVIRPRVAALKAHLDPIAASEAEGSRHTCCLRWSHTSRFPAMVCLDIGITRDGDARTLIVQYRLQIQPVFFPFAGSDDLKFPIDQVDPERAASWLDDKLVTFVETYLRLEVERHYEEANRETDPVCGMSVNRADAPPQAEYGGNTFYFCVADCRARFVADPERYVPRAPDPM